MKKAAAIEALKFVKPGMNIGLGTGSTANHFIEALGARVKEGLDVRGVPTSKATEELAREHGIPLVRLHDYPHLDLTVDGADEFDPEFRLIKGGGGALTREKILAAASRKFVCIIDQSKWVATLGQFPLPVEVIPMARSYVARQFLKVRGQPVWRQGVVTDNGNHILDVRNLQISNPVEFESRFNQVAGIVTVGLFANRPADVILLADDSGVKRMDRRGTRIPTRRPRD